MAKWLNLYPTTVRRGFFIHDPFKGVNEAQFLWGEETVWVFYNWYVGMDRKLRRTTIPGIEKFLMGGDVYEENDW